MSKYVELECRVGIFSTTFRPQEFRSESFTCYWPSRKFQATDMHEEDQTRDMEETEMDISENEIEEQNEAGDTQQALRDPHTNKMSQMICPANF